MPKIIKLLTGPQEGAELELDENLPVRIGSGEDCDVVVVDAMMPEKALELTVDDGNIIVKPLAEQIFSGNELMKAGVQTTEPDYTVFTCGTTRLAVGEADKPWPPLSWQPLEKLLEKREKTAEEEEQERKRLQLIEDQKRQQKLKEEEHLRQLKINEERKARRQARRHRIAGLICWLSLLVICLLAAWYAARKAWILAAPPKATDQADIALQELKRSNLDSLIEKYGLTVTELPNGQGKKLTGNLPNATIRLYIQQLLKNKYFGITNELTDDETLAHAVRELLWGATNGCVELVSLKNQVAMVTGMTATEKEWNTICNNISKDIPRLKKIEQKVVFADVMAAKLVKAFQQANFQNIRTENEPLAINVLGEVTEDRKGEFESLLREARKYFPAKAKLNNLVKWMPKPEAKPLPLPKPKLVVARKPAPKPLKLPITSIRMQPVPCIVMTDGSRYAEGAVLNGCTITDITLDSVTLMKDKKVIKLKP